MDAPLVNRIAESGLITLNLEEYYPKQKIAVLDIKDYWFKGLILKEKDFRLALKEHDWSQYEGQILCVYCSTDAIIPVWAFMLVSSYAGPVSEEVYVGDQAEYLKHHYYKTLSALEPGQYQDARIVIKGCSHKPVPPAAYAYLTELLKPVAKSIMYGEPCSTVPIYKRPLKRVR